MGRQCYLVSLPPAVNGCRAVISPVIAECKARMAVKARHDENWSGIRAFSRAEASVVVVKRCMGMSPGFSGDGREFAAKADFEFFGEAA